MAEAESREKTVRDTLGRQVREMQAQTATLTTALEAAEKRETNMQKEWAMSGRERDEAAARREREFQNEINSLSTQLGLADATRIDMAENL